MDQSIEKLIELLHQATCNLNDISEKYKKLQGEHLLGQIKIEELTKDKKKVIQEYLDLKVQNSLQKNIIESQYGSIDQTENDEDLIKSHVKDVNRISVEKIESTIDFLRDIHSKFTYGKDLVLCAAVNRLLAFLKRYKMELQSLKQ